MTEQEVEGLKSCFVLFWSISRWIGYGMEAVERSPLILWKFLLSGGF